MNDSNALVPAHPSPPIDIDVTAESADEMAQCQSALIRWAQNKVASVQAEHTDLADAYAHAVKCKWRNDTLKRQMDLAAKRLDFYQRLLIALEHGYQIVPSFPITAFAIRTDRKKPKAKYAVSSWSGSDGKEQEPKQLEAGEGAYQNPFPIVLQGQTKNEKGETRFQTWASEWDTMEFPISMAKPQIMEATSRAMALKIFDDIGLCPQDPKADPMIIARLLMPRSHNWASKRYVSFIIAWHLNTRDL